MVKKKRLPKNFEELLKEGDARAIMSVFDVCDIDASSGSTGKTALAFDEIPDETARWLVQQGASLEAPDQYGYTPLHNRTRGWRGRIGILLELGAEVSAGEGARDTPIHIAAERGNSDNIHLLLKHGAKIEALNGYGLTPLEHALQQCTNAAIERVVNACKILLDKGAQKTPQTREFARRIGTQFEFFRDRFNKDLVEAADAALSDLYSLFEVPPVPRRSSHDGNAAIIAKAAGWQAQHQELWELLVPSGGPAPTIQGEVIRISGRVANELENNGGMNWDADYKNMADAFLMYVGSADPLPPHLLNEAAVVVEEVKSAKGGAERMCELAVKWVAQNEDPIALPKPSYRR